MARRSKREPKPIGLLGSGKVTAAAAKQHLSDFTEAADSDLIWLLPFSEANTKSMNATIDFLYNEDVTYVLVSDDTVEDEDLEENASEVVTVSDAEELAAEMVTRLGASDPPGTLVMILDESQDADLDAVEAAVSAGVTALDLAAGMHTLEFEDEDVPATTEPEPEPDPVDEAASSGAEEDAPMEMPEDVLAELEAGDAQAAIDLLKKLERDVLVELAEAQGLVVEKGIHRKTIAENLVGLILGGDSDPDPDPEPPTPKPKKAAPQPTADAPSAAPAAPEAAPQAVPPAAVTEAEEAAPVVPDVLGAPDEMMYVIIANTAQVVAARGVEDGRAFVRMLRDEGLLAEDG